MAKQRRNGFDKELIAHAMTYLLGRAKPGPYGLQFLPRASIFVILAKALHISKPEARRLVAELQRMELIELLNVGPGPRLVVVKQPPSEPKRRRNRRKAAEQPPAPEPEEIRQPEESAAPEYEVYTEMQLIDAIKILQADIEVLQERKKKLHEAAILWPRSIEVPAGYGEPS